MGNFESWGHLKHRQDALRRSSWRALRRTWRPPVPAKRLPEIPGRPLSAGQANRWSAHRTPLRSTGWSWESLRSSSPRSRRNRRTIKPEQHKFAAWRRACVFPGSAMVCRFFLPIDSYPLTQYCSFPASGGCGSPHGRMGPETPGQLQHG